MYLSVRDIDQPAMAPKLAPFSVSVSLLVFSSAIDRDDMISDSMIRFKTTLFWVDGNKVGLKPEAHCCSIGEYFGEVLRNGIIKNEFHSMNISNAMPFGGVDAKI